MRPTMERSRYNVDAAKWRKWRVCDLHLSVVLNAARLNRATAAAAIIGGSRQQEADAGHREHEPVEVQQKHPAPAEGQ